MNYEQGILNQNLGFIRPKNIVMEGLMLKAEELGTMRSRFDFTFEYPRLETMPQDPRNGQTYANRKVVIKKIQSVPRLKGIGQIYAAETELDLMLEAEGYGQVDSHNIEISVWSSDPNDRDNLIDLIKIWMLELNRNVQEDGLPFFYRHGVYAVEEVKVYETLDRSNVTTPFHVGILVYELLCPFYGTHTEKFERYKYELITKITEPQNGTVITNPNGPALPGGSGSSPETTIIKDNYTSSLPGGAASDGKNRNDTVIIPGPNTEERTTGGLSIPIGG